MCSFLVIGVFLSALPLFFFLLLTSRRSNTSRANLTAAGLLAHPLLGNLPDFLRNRRRLLDWFTDLLATSPTNTIPFRRPGNIRGVITANPANVEHLLRTHFDRFPKGPRFISHLRDFLGQGIFNVDGDLWRAQRKAASFEFNTRSLRTFVLHTVESEISDRLLPLLRNSAASGEVIDIQDVLERFAFDNVCKVAFNEDPACLATSESDRSPKLSSRFAQSFRDAAELSAGRFRYAVPRFWMLKRLLNVGSERRLRESISAVHDFAAQIIRSRKKESCSAGADLLSRFVASEQSSEEYLRDIVISFILAGRESTSSALTWFFWLLSSNPAAEEKILAEIGSLRAAAQNQGSPKKQTLDFEELRGMHYMHAAISEAMRLYPPVAMNTTMCAADDVLPDGTEVKKGMFASYNAYAMGRMENIWGKDCREFRPERWLDAAGEFRQESSFRYPVFHAGPRMCLGKEMAYIQMKSLAACILEGFEMEVVAPERSPEQALSLTLRMKGGLPVRVRERRAAGIACTMDGR